MIRLTVAVVLAAAVTWLSHRETGVAAQAQGLGVSRVQEAECLGGGVARVTRGDRAGRLRFIGTESARAIRRLDALMVTNTPEASARAYLSRCAGLFGVTDQGADLVVQRPSAGSGNRSILRFQQVHEGIPVIGGELIVHLDGDLDILSVSGETLTDTAKPETTALIPADAAARTALETVSQQYGLGTGDLIATTPERWIHDPALLGGPAAAPQGSALVWRVEVRPAALLPIRELVLVDARLGTVRLHFNQVETALNRSTHTANNSTVLPGVFVCGEADPSCSAGDAHAAAAHLSARDTYEFYRTTHNRDSLDNAGAALVSTVHYGVNFANAFFDSAGNQMVYGDAYGYALADDVVGHELTHGVTRHTSNLFYYYQSGAINESFSDIWGEFIDQTNGRGNDTAQVKWLLGEDVSGRGASRNLANPPAMSHPDRITSPLYYVSTGDNGGVHINSGVNNKAAFLMVDGGTFNGQTVAPLGISKVARIYYEVQTNLLTSGSDYADLFDALFQACNNLVGTAGIILGDCDEVRKATLAVEMHLQPVPGFNPDAPVCVTGSPATIFFDGFETGTTQVSLGARWSRPQANSVTSFARSGRYSLFATDSPASALATAASLNSDRLLPAAAYLHFAHAFGFQKDFDGGVVEYSTNGGGTWTDLGALVDTNGYNGTLAASTGNPLSGRAAFTGQSHGYISSRANLAALSGQSVRFRWRMGLDGSGQERGWYVDDVHLYTCSNPGAPVISTITPALGPAAGGSSVTITGTGFLAGAQVTLGGSAAVVTAPSATTIVATTPAHPAGTVDVVVTNPGGASATLSNGFTFIGPPTLTSISPLSGPSLGGTTVTVAGTNFVTGTAVTIGGVAASIVSVSSTSITVTTSARPAGVVSVTVRNPDGQAFTLSDAFTYVASAPPVVATVVPATGFSAGGTAITIIGSGFAPGASVTIGGMGAVSTVVNATTISAITPPRAVGAANVSVTNPDGQTGTLANGFTYIPNPPPTVSGILPNRAPTAGGTAVTIFGAVFTPGATVTIGGVPASNVTVVSPGRITATTGAYATFITNDVAVTNPTGQSGTLPGAFVYEIRANNDQFAQRYPIVGTGALTSTGSNIGFTSESGEPSDLIGGGGTSSAWWVWTSPCTFQVSSPSAFLDTSGSSFDTVLALFSGSSLSTLSLMAADDDGGDGLASRVPNAGTLTITAGQTYYIRVRGYNTTASTSTGAIRLRMNSPDCLPPPTITSISPATGGTASSFDVTVTGSDFVAGTALAISGSGVSALNTTVVNSTTLTATVTVSSVATLGTRTVSVTTPGGTASLPAFTVQVGMPRLGSISVNAGVRNGSSFPVTLVGDNFQPGMTVGAMPGVTVSNVVVESTTRATATFTVAPDAPLGTHPITLTTAAGTATTFMTFTVADPFPDLRPSISHTYDFVAGFDGTYTVTVTNVGLVPTTGAIHVNEVLSPGMGVTMVAAGGNGWSCTFGPAGFNCQTSEVLAPGASSSFPVTLSVGTSTGFSHSSASATTAGDVNTANNLFTGDFTRVLPSPLVVVTSSPAAPGPRQQALATLSIAQPLPYPFSGSLTLGFTPNAVAAANDPAIQFATGGRSVPFTFDANSTQARIGGASSPGPIAFQTGTVAGTLALTASSTAGSISTTRPPLTIVLPRQAPVLVAVEADTQGGALQAVVTLYSNPREVLSVTLTFNTTPAVRLSCSVPATCSSSGNSLTLDVRPQFGAWYATDSTYGSLTTLRLPLAVEGGTLRGSISVTIRNSVGASSPMSVTLP